MIHASDFSKVGVSWYQTFVTAELSESIIHSTKMILWDPYGDANSADSDENIS